MDFDFDIFMSYMYISKSEPMLEMIFSGNKQNGVVRRSVGIRSQWLSAEHKFILDALRESKDRNAMKPTI